MICRNCKKDVSKPLELYNGTLACPNCKKPNDPSIDGFEVTQENQEIYVIAECLYFKWLLLKAKNIPTKNEKLLDQAIEMCRAAAFKSHPLAVIRLAYFYDKGHADKDGNSTLRSLLAYNYYNSICSCTESPKGYQEIISKGNWFEVRKRAARLMLDMLSKLSPAEVASHPELSYNKKLELFKGQSLISDADQEQFVGENQRSNVTISEEQFGEDVLGSCFSSQRAPVMGWFRLKGSALKKMFEEQSLSFNRAPQLSVWIAACNNNGRVEFTGDAFQKLSNGRKINLEMGKAQDDTRYFVYFFNDSNGKHFYLSKGFRRAAENAIERSDFTLIQEAVNGTTTYNRDFVFYDDDLFFHKDKMTTATKVIEKLMDRVIKNSTGGCNA